MQRRPHESQGEEQGGHVEEGVHLAAMTRHMLGLFHGRPGARAWRRILTEQGVKAGAGLEVVERALAAVTDDAPQARRALEAVG